VKDDGIPDEHHVVRHCRGSHVLASGRVVGAAKSPDGCRLQVRHLPLERSPSHTGIYGYTPEDELIADLIAQTVTAIHPATPSFE